MALNPTAAEFHPCSPQPAPNFPAAPKPDQLQQVIREQPTPSKRKVKYGIYKSKRHAIIHTLMRTGYESAQVSATYTDYVDDENAKDKLVKNLVRLLAGLGWSTSTVLRACVLLEEDPMRDVLGALEEARRLGEDLHRRRAAAGSCEVWEDECEGKAFEVDEDDG